MKEEIKVKVKALEDFVVRVFQKLGVSLEDAKVTADVLISADRRGIGSHGVARLGRYVKGLKEGLIKPLPKIEVVHQTPVSALIDGGEGLGQVVGVWAMKRCIEGAKKSGIYFAAVRNSNHYGIAGYYAMMALEDDLIGISLTNSAPLVVPTFGKDATVGTNPISVAVPAGRERPFVLDMATSTVPRGKLEEYRRKELPLPLSWATDAQGKPTSNAGEVLDNLIARKGGGLLPLGGAGEELGGHKGYGLTVLVDIFCGVLSGGAWGPLTYKDKAGICHFFGAMRIDAFLSPEEFKRSMDEMIQTLKGSAKAAGQSRIYIHGEKEYEMEERQKDEVALFYKVVDSLKRIGKDLGVEYDF
jgi:LDH2 family malate/lactate/ureidoglycolate dehydrogenase